MYNCNTINFNKGGALMNFGLFEELISKSLQEELNNSDISYNSQSINDSNVTRLLSKYVMDLFEQKLNEFNDESDSLTKQLEYTNKLIYNIIGDDQLCIDENDKQLLTSINNHQNSALAINDKKQIIRPETSLVFSSLFTGSINEPTMMSELKKEIVSCQRIDMIVSFIKWSGLRQIIDELRAFTDNGGCLRIITTSYMGATDIKAIDELYKLNNTEIYISYNTKTTRLHAKSYIFHRDTGYSTSYIGSSNLSNAAISSGLEWNVKIGLKKHKETFKKVQATFESYLNSNDFVLYLEEDRELLRESIDAEKYSDKDSNINFLFDLKPYNYQQEILDKLEVERTVKGYYKNLVVAATGTGKTIISAFDFKSYRDKNRNAKILFVAHRKEILEQSLSCFRSILKDPNFGDLLVDGIVPDSINCLFASVQSFNAKQLWNTITEDYFDFIIVDEIHHAKASSYDKLFNFFKPKILLGLTATPERSDGLNILEYFDNRIAAEIRLPEAIERKLLCPFQYFGISDTVDLSDLKWSMGGYNKSELSNLFTGNHDVAINRASHVIQSLEHYTTSIHEIVGVGFCVSVEHAKFMAEFFNKHSIPSGYVTGDIDSKDRHLVKEKLINKEINFIFAVDIYNEGVDIPEINTVLFLRPTESLTVFLQQLGRGLRLHENKECLTVLDFVGQANKKYNYTEKFNALTTSMDLKNEIDHGFTSVPKGCYIQLEKKAKEYILSNIKEGMQTKASIVAKVKSFEEDTGLKLCLENFITYHNLPIEFIYKNNKMNSDDNTSFTEYCYSAGVIDKYKYSSILTNSFKKLSKIDSPKFIHFILHFIDNLSMDLNEEELLMLNMLEFTIFDEIHTQVDVVSLFVDLINCKELICELKDMLNFKLTKLDIIPKMHTLPYICPLEVHSTYYRDQILVSLGYNTPNNVREGVKEIEDRKTFVLMVTLNRNIKDYSITTMYDNYSMSNNLFHWQSQNKTSDTSVVGLKYINHEKESINILLFVRENKNDQNKQTMPYTFLGQAKYVSHQDNKPMSIIWELDEKIPAKFLKKTNNLIIE